MSLMYVIHELVFTLRSELVVELQVVMCGDSFESQMHSHSVSDWLLLKPIGHVQSKKWMATWLVEGTALSHGPSAKRINVSESCGENTVNVKFVQLLPTC